jgi:hypothetical protein
VNEDRRDLRLVEAAGFDNGLVLLRYTTNRDAPAA